ncbi:unnamed protein product [Colias eurytheme]|nr:unnamed protein product [Colias eurytheme]
MILLIGVIPVCFWLVAAALVDIRNSRGDEKLDGVISAQQFKFKDCRKSFVCLSSGELAHAGPQRGRAARRPQSETGPDATRTIRTAA